MGMFGSFAVTLTVLVALTGYVFYEPLPPGIDQTLEVRIFSSLTIILEKATSLMLMLDYNDTEIFQGARWFHEEARKNPPLDNDQGLQMYDAVFDSVKVRVYRPKYTKRNLPALVYYHGGGWALLSINTHHHFVKTLAHEANIVIVSVEYRLAPEFPFPIPLEDCLTATKYFIRNAEKFGADSTRIGVAGDSAGGNLAAAVSQILSKGPTEFAVITHQILIYPLLQAFDFRTPSKMKQQLPFLKTRLCAKFVLSYYNVSEMHHLDTLLENKHISSELINSKYAEYISHDLLPEKYQFDRRHGDQFGVVTDRKFSDDFAKVMTNESFAPLMSDDLSYQPPSLVITAEHDPLRDDGLMYARRLEDSGVKVVLHHIENGFHGFINGPPNLNFRLFETTMDEIVKFLDYINLEITDS